MNNQHLQDIKSAMIDAKLPEQFVDQAVLLAETNDGVKGLLELWHQFNSQEDKDEVVIAVQEAIEDDAEYRPAQDKPSKRPAVDFEDMEYIAEHIVSFKRKLKNAVDRKGGIVVLARKTGMPESSLSRFFSSTSRPRRTTLYKIAEALDLQLADIVFDHTV
jgi:DNA-binding phage protein